MANLLSDILFGLTRGVEKFFTDRPGGLPVVNPVKRR